MNICMELEHRSGVLLASSKEGDEDADICMLTLASFYLVKDDRSYFPEWLPDLVSGMGIRMCRPLVSPKSVTDYLITLGSNVGTAVGAYARGCARPFRAGRTRALSGSRPTDRGRAIG